MSGKQESFYQKFQFELEDFSSYGSQGELIEAIAIQIYIITINAFTAH